MSGELVNAVDTFELHMRTAKLSPDTIRKRIEVIRRLEAFLLSVEHVVLTVSTDKTGSTASTTEQVALLAATPDDLASFQGTFAHLAPASVDIYSRHVRAFYAWAVKFGHVTVDPTSRLVSVRVRRDLGDLDSLKASLTGRGLINPIGVKTDGTLVTGERRLTAARELGWAKIDARVYRDISDLELLDIEVEENVCRKALTPGEAEKRYTMRKALLTETEGGQGKRTDLTSAKFAEVTRKKAAKGTGHSYASLDKVTKVRETAEDETVEPEVRNEAQRQLDALTEGTAKPDPALKAVEAAKRRAEKEKSKLKTGLGPGQSPTTRCPSSLGVRGGAVARRSPSLP
jgi:ParB-like chromosome segregation protein Spo0J